MEYQIILMTTDGDCSDILEAGFTDADGDGQLDGTGIAENGTVVEVMVTLLQI